MSVELVSFSICPFVQRAVIALQEKAVEYKVTYIALDNQPDWFKAISPFGKLPLLRIGDEVLFESAIINEYLDEVYPPQLHPAEPLQRAKHRGWIELGSNLLVEQFQMLVADTEDNFLQACESLGGSLARLEKAMGEGPYFAGVNFSLLDAAFAPLFMRFEIIRQQSDLLEDLLPSRLQTWSAELLERDSVKASVREDFEQEFLDFFKSKDAYVLSHL